MIAEPFADARSILQSLQPDNVNNYVVALGDAFNGTILYGPFDFEGALNWVVEREDWKIVPVWKIE